jgi:hypothetical protein
MALEIQMSPREPPMFPPPIVLGLTICEKVIVEEGTKNVTLVSTFTKLQVDTFPTVAQRFTVYTVLTGGLGDGTIDLIVRNLETDQVVYEAKLPVRLTDRLMELRVLFRVTNCVFPSPGAYQVTLLLDGEWLAQRRVNVAKKGT